MAALAIADKKEDNDNPWDIESYNEASKKLFTAVQQDLEDFDIEEFPIVHIKKSC